MTRANIFSWILAIVAVVWLHGILYGPESKQPTQPAQPAPIADEHRSDALTSLSECVDREARNGAYSSYDGGQSVLTIMNDKCRFQIYAYLSQKCDKESDLQKETCFKQVYLSTAEAIQIQLKTYNK